MIGAWALEIPVIASDSHLTAVDAAVTVCSGALFMLLPFYAAS